MHKSSVGTLSFAPGVDQQWRDIVFDGVVKGGHGKRQAELLMTISNYQDAAGEAATMIIQRLGRGKWCLITFRTVLSTIKHTLITNICGFSAEVANQQIMEYSDAKLRQTFFDLQSANDETYEATMTKFMFLTGLIEMYKSKMVTCTAGPSEAARVINCIEGLLDQMDRCEMKAEDGMTELLTMVQRMHKAAERRS